MNANADWCPTVVDYSAASFPAPRAWQTGAIESLREGARNGHRRQILCAPVGGGKTMVALQLLHGSLLKGKRAIFVCDRTALINQTSARADSYGMPHGIVQANHWRRDNSIPFQICSIQTIAARGYWPEADLIVLDEAHSQYAVATEKALSTSAAVIGLTATPCAKGMGKTYTNLVNAATMHDLTQEGILVPMRILSCVRPDMAGAATSGGEWTARAAAEREATIIGDVVGEWISHGENRKTIAFGADIAYCRELVGRFNQAGIVAECYTSETPDEVRAELVKEFEKPDSSIRILVSVAALSKGFDVPDVSCIIDARPLRRSLSEAIQMWGRGLRCAPGKSDCILLDHCIASGQRVLTNEGLVPIEKITISHRLWDGHEFISHLGVISRGIRPVIRYAGITATADHPVKTAQGWRTLGHCADEQIAIRTTGIGRKAVRECDDYFTNSCLARPTRAALSACALRVRYMWLSCCDRALQFRAWCNERMQGLQSAKTFSEMAVRQGEWDASTLSQSERSAVRGLRWPGDRVPFRFRDHLRSLDSRQFGNPGKAGNAGVGPHQQQWPLRARKSALGHTSSQYEQYASLAMGTSDASIQAQTPGGALRRYFSAALALVWAFFRPNCEAVEQPQFQAEREVWDILGAGPRNSFTCEGLLVHNSGNIVRFLADFEDVYHNGFKTLDDGEKLDRIVRKEEEDYVPKGCPQCGHKPFNRRCLSCGFEKQTKAEVEEAAGVMQEIRLGKKVLASDKQDLWNQLCTYARAHLKTDKKSGWVWYKFQDITGERPPRGFSFDSAPDVHVSSATLGKLKQLHIAYRHRREH